MELRTTPWEDYHNPDYDPDCVIAALALDPYANDRVEYAALKRTSADTAACFHGLVDLKDYLDTPHGLSMLNGIFRNQGYASFDDFVLEGSGKDPAAIDKANDPDYVVDLRLTAVHIAGYQVKHAAPSQSIPMPAREAAAWFTRLTGLDPDTIPW